MYQKHLAQSFGRGTCRTSVNAAALEPEHSFRRCGPKAWPLRRPPEPAFPTRCAHTLALTLGLLGPVLPSSASPCLFCLGKHSFLALASRPRPAQGRRRRLP